MSGATPARSADAKPWSPTSALSRSPAHLRIGFGQGVRLDLILHSTDGIRQTVRPRGLNGVARNYNGAIEIPAATYKDLASMPPRVREWVAANLTPGRFTTSPLAVTTTSMRSLSQCWQLTLNGRPARPEELRVAPDPGAVAGWLTKMVKDGRPPGLCL